MRHIIILIDGTTNTASRGLRESFTNTFQIASALKGSEQDPNDQHIFLYFPGPSARWSPSRWLGIGLGYEINDMVKEVYVAICMNILNVDDKIYLFGFSRGAVVAKIVAEMIDFCGIILRDKISLFAEAWKLYMAKRRAPPGRAVDRGARKLKIDFLGLFDPVLGLRTWALKVKPGYILPDSVKYAVEILALDEKRFSFRPTVYREPQTKGVFDDYIVRTGIIIPQLRLEQIWMPGAHSNVGHPKRDNVLASISFLVMLERIQSKTNLSLNKMYIEKFFLQLLHERDFRLAANFRLWNYFRRIEKTRGCQLHPIYDLVAGQRIYINNVLRVYKCRSMQTDLHLGRYALNLETILNNKNNKDAERQLFDAVDDMITQVA